MPDDPPDGRSDYARNPDDRKEHPRDEHDAVHAPLQFSDVKRHDRLLQKNRELHHARAKQHALHDGYLEKVCLRTARFDPFDLLSRRLLDVEDDEKRDDEESDAPEEEGGTHAEGFCEKTAHEGTEHAARRHGALHRAETEPQLRSRRVHRHDRKARRPEPRRKALQYAHAEELPDVLHETAQNVGDRKTDRRAYSHEFAALFVGHRPPDRRHDPGNRKGDREDDPAPKIHFVLRDVEFLNEVHRQEGNEHRIARRHQKRARRQDDERQFPGFGVVVFHDLFIL